MKVFAYQEYKEMSEKNGPAGIRRGRATVVLLAIVYGCATRVAGRPRHSLCSPTHPS